MTENWNSAAASKLSDFQNALFGYMHRADARNMIHRTFDEHDGRGDFANMGLDSVSSALKQNATRLRAHMALPLAVFNYGRRFQEYYSHLAQTQLPGEMLCSTGLSATSEMAMHRWMLGLNTFETTIGYITLGTHVAGFATYPGHDKDSQLDTFYASLIIEAWTLFESLAEDLWEAALNFHPTVLGKVGGKASVTFDDLEFHGFDVRTKLGTILKRKQNRLVLDRCQTLRIPIVGRFRSNSPQLKQSSRIPVCGTLPQCGIC